MKSSPFDRHAKPLNADMNVVPYIDVMLVLLVIFMVTAPMLSTGVDVDLPKDKTNTLTTGTQLPVIISLQADGALFISYEQAMDVPVSQEELINTLLRLQSDSQAAIGQPLQVMIHADQNNQYGSIMHLMASIQQAGIEKVGLLTGQPLTQPSQP